MRSGEWNLFDFRGDRPWGWTAAHEAGHLMGLEDRYNENGVVYPHGRNHIMGENGATNIDQAAIWNIIQFARRSGSLTQR